MIKKDIYDIIGIGVGPFNLGLAAITHPIKSLNCIFFDQSKEFNWHAGMLLPNAKLQVPFYADLITVVDPCSPFTFLNYLKENKKLFRFAIHEDNFISRKEYNAYCRWVIQQLEIVHFHHKVVDIQYESIDDLYTVMIHDLSSDSHHFYSAKHLVIGVGSSPTIPECVKDLKHLNIIHSEDYLFNKNELLQQPSITIIGGGQSAAEIFYDLLQCKDDSQKLDWFTRSERFYPMEYSRLTLEMTSPDYIEYFYSLAPHKKKEILSKQNMLYKGINFSLINEIYDALYYQQSETVRLFTNSELKAIQVQQNNFQLQFYHSECEEKFESSTNAVILATGYRNTFPAFLSAVRDQILESEDGSLQVNRNYSIDTSGKRIFVQNAELHSHGFNAPDLGMGPYRNANILNSILGYEHFKMEKQIAFQSFGLPYVKER